MSLAGKRVVITRAAHQAPELERLLVEAGAEVIVYPTIAVVPVEGEERRIAEEAVAALRRGDYAAVVFTSANAVRALAAIAGGALPGIPAFAVGGATARALAAHGVVAEVAQAQSGAGLAETVTARFSEIWSRRFLVPRARQGRPELADGLEAVGAAVDRVVVYDTVALTDGPSLPAGRIDWVLFMSPSAVAGFVARAQLPAGARVACIGSTTERAARAAGLRVDVVSAEPDAAALVAALT